MGTNRYAYSGNNPVNGSDPGGKRLVEGIYDGGLSADERDDSDIVSYDICSDRGCMTGIRDTNSDWQARTTTYANPETGMGHTMYQSERDLRILYTTANVMFTAVTLPFAVSDAVKLYQGYQAWRAGSALRATVAAGGYAADALAVTGSRTSQQATEGIYWFLENGVPYVGQSANIDRRLAQHLASGKLAAGVTVFRMEVLGGKTAREVAEYLQNHGVYRWLLSGCILAGYE